MSMTATSFRKLLATSRSRIQLKVFEVLRDRKWHCRHVLTPISGQPAGGGGIQGLQRGARSRPGLRILSKSRYCLRCRQKRTHDQWTGQFQGSVAASAIPAKLRKRILTHYGYRDVIERRRRDPYHLVIDHKFPMRRWGATEPPNRAEMTPAEIEARFQLLKKDSFGNYNKLKDAACATCFSTRRRGKPFGIDFFYAGGPRWPPETPMRGQGAERGCVGCGWYDFSKWRESLNESMKRKTRQPS